MCAKEGQREGGERGRQGEDKHTMEFYSVINKNEIVLSVGKMELKITMLSTLSQFQNKFHVFFSHLN